MMGLGAPNLNDGGVCGTYWPWDCYMRPHPIWTTSAAQPTRVFR